MHHPFFNDMFQPNFLFFKPISVKSMQHYNNPLGFVCDLIKISNPFLYY